MELRLSQEALAWWLWAARWSTRLLGAGSLICGVLIKIAPSSLGLDLDPSADKSIQDAAQLAFPALLISVPIVESFRRKLEKKTLWPLVKEILDEFRKQLYEKNELHLHKVTLFKRCGWVLRARYFQSFGWGWLKVIQRSGHTSQNSRRVFFAPNDQDKAEGVAGLAWAWNSVVYREDLPNLKNGVPSERSLKQYADDSNYPLELVRKTLPSSRAICGIPVEVGGKVWGVLVVDSRQAKLPKEKIEQHYPLVARFLGRILERL